MVLKAVCRAVIAAAVMATAGAAEADPTLRLWGTSYAVGKGSVVLGGQTRTVRVSVALPAHAQCASAGAIGVEPVPNGASLANPLIAAPVTVVLEPARCHGDWRDGWVNFVLPYIGSTDILAVNLISPAGQPLSAERIAVEMSTDSNERGD